MKVNAINLRPGNAFLQDGKLLVVIKNEINQPGKGASVAQVEGPADVGQRLPGDLDGLAAVWGRSVMKGTCRRQRTSRSAECTCCR